MDKNKKASNIADKGKNKISKTILALSFLYAFFILFGFSFIISNSWNLILGGPLNLILSIFIYSFFVFISYKVLDCLFEKVNKGSLFEGDFQSRFSIINKMLGAFDKHPFIFSLIFMLIAWLPYIIAYYPILLNPDSSYQIKQFFGVTNLYNLFSELIDSNVIITNHHPVIHTLLLGSTLKLGHFLENDNFGLFIYSAIQITILSSALSYSIVYLKRIGVSSKYRVIILLIYSILPIYPFYAMTGVKDVIFSALIVFYIIILHQILLAENKLGKWKYIGIFILMMMIILFRNNGFHVILLSFPWLILVNKKLKKELLLILVLVIVFSLSYTKVVLPYFKITPSSIRESLSIPFQQTARYVKYYGNEVTLKEQGIIDILLDYETLADRYKPEISDPVKNSFNRFYEDDDLKNYFQVWLKQFIKHPGVYFEATMNNTYGYFFPLKINWYIYHNFNPSITEDGFEYSFNNLGLLRDILYYPTVVLPYIPVLGLAVNIGFHVWLLIFMTGYMGYRKYYKGIIVFSPALVLVLVCIASPVNAYYRYALPFIFSMPLMIGLFSHIVKKQAGSK